MYCFNVYMFIFFVFFCAKEINTECRQTYATLCDSITDLKDVRKGRIQRMVIVGSEDNSRRQIPVNLNEDIKWNLFDRVKIFVIINQVSELLLNANVRDLNQGAFYNFDYLSFYRNTMKQIRKTQFPKLGIEKLILINNKIEKIENGSFASHKIVEIDISDNLLETIEVGALPSTNVTEIIIIKNNRLMYLEPGCFPRSLKTLSLQNNKLNLIEDGVLTDLAELKHLVLGNNKLRNIPKIEHLTNLFVFDISGNLLKTIDYQTFRSLEKLYYLDLSNNLLFDPNFNIVLNNPVKYYYKLVINLSLNRFKDLNLKNLNTKIQKYSLYGNPFDCHRIDDIRSALLDSYDCEAKFLSSGTVPICVNYSSINSQWPVFDDEQFYVNLLLNASRTQVEKLKCDVNPVKSVVESTFFN